MGVTETDRCDLCKVEKETIKHFFVECPNAQAIWKGVQNFVKDEFKCQLNLNAYKIITSMGSESPKTKVFLNLVITITKQKLFTAKCQNQKPSVTSICNEILFIQDVDRQKAIRTGNIKKYNNMWPDTLEHEQSQQKIFNDIV